MWVLQQLFEDVQTIKPNSSRSQSSEIFILCLKYTAPKYIDPKLLDPNHVFKEVVDPGLKKVDVLHKKYDKLNQRHRTGYDDNAGVLVRPKASITEFIMSKEPVQMLTDVNELYFTEECEQFKTHPKTKAELLTCFTDLRLLGKIDFKKILKWRTLMREFIGIGAPKKKNSDEDDNDEDDENNNRKYNKEMTEEDIQNELYELQAKAQLAQRKDKKKAREEASKQRVRQNLGMTNNAFEVSEDVELFQMDSNLTSEQIEALGDVDLSDLDEDDLNNEDSNNDNSDNEDNKKAIFIEEDDLEDQLENAYTRYQSGKRLKEISSGVIDPEEERTLSMKQHKKSKTSEYKINQLNKEDNMLGNDDLDAYVNLLSKGTQATSTKKTKKNEKEEVRNKRSNDNDDDDDSSDDDDSDENEDRNDNDSNNSDNIDDDDDEDEEEENEPKRRKMVTKDELSLATKSNKWFSHSIFKSSLINPDGNNNDDDEEEEVSSNIKNKKDNIKKNKRNNKNDDNNNNNSDNENDELVMPLSEKQKRKEARKKQVEKQERKASKRQRQHELEEDEANDPGPLAPFSVVKQQSEEDDEDNNNNHANNKNSNNSSINKNKFSQEERQMIKEGLGRALGGNNNNSNNNSESNKKAKKGESNFEIVPQDNHNSSDTLSNKYALPEVKDTRQYDSENEDYDGHDRLMTLALGTMMLRKSRKKAFVDASYNRFSWNDPSNLPSWFMDDEVRYNKPQLPIPPALLEQIKSRYQTTGTNEIKKVAEARARKRKRAAAKLKSAKKQASMMAENSEMTEKQKLKAISKAMKNNKIDKPGKVYVVSKHTKAGSTGVSGGGKGKLKFVDKRMKKDARMMKAKEKRKKR